MKFQVHLARLVRECKVVTVEAENPDDIDLDALYEKEDGSDWEADAEWGCEEGTHCVLNEDGT